MALSLKRDRKSPSLEQVIAKREDTDPQDSLLADDSDAFSQSKENDVDIKLALSLEGETQKDDQSHKMDNNESSLTGDVVPFETGPGVYRGRTHFEVMSADIVKSEKSSFVMYKILIVREGILDKAPSIIERRYSDLEKLNSSLRKKYPKIMRNVAFPKKLVIGNFTNETIAQRSRAFEQFLSHLEGLDSMRFTVEFAEFFYLLELKEAYKLICDDKYLEAVDLIQKCLPIQEKIQGDYSPGLGATICALVACYQVLDKRELALRYAESALKCFTSNEENTYFLPLVQVAIHLSWKLGRNKQDLENILTQMEKKGIHTELSPSLLSVVKTRFRSS
ncbi:hypothetical protein CHS0354_022703 [Potamilus streckersoni]|uniref:PX domain-containing protein n=1 Tax=Potamilus streckersoni TaxID=2493646 RepID=A0AAE0RTE6_9BIVA|nr:hypothetical protein CHS0354_022703 [Potamilus streckersoni]